MLTDASGDLQDKSRLLLGAGFVFGVAFTMGLTAIVTVTVTSVGERLAAVDALVTIAAGVCFAAIVGASLYFLAFPENRLGVPVESLFEYDEGTAAEE